MKKYVLNVVSVVLIITMLLGSLTVYAVDGEVTAESEMPYTEASGTFADTYDGTVYAYSSSEAEAAGVPVGYFGAVIKVTPGTNAAYAGCEFDFSSQNIPTDNIASITFRVNLPTGHSEMRLLGETSPTSWVMRATPESLGSWCDLTLSAEGGNFQSGKSMSSLANSDGNLGKVCLIARLGSGSDNSYYLDSITVTYKDGVTDDTTPPVITYTGETELTLLVGSTLGLVGITAYDEYDSANASVSEEWSDGALRSDGTLNIGSHTVKIVATDRSGNSSYITLSVTVVADSSVIEIDEIPCTDFISDVSAYDGVAEQLTAEEAAAAEVPEGYRGNVLKVSSDTARFGVTIDPAALGIPVKLIDKMTVKILLYDSTNAFRLTNHGGTNWNVLKDATSGEWMEYTMCADGTGFSNGKFEELAGDDGNLGVFSIATNDKTGNMVFYIDSIVIMLKKDDGSAPVLNYNGETSLNTSAGKPFVIDAAAYDALSDTELALNYDFSDGAVDTDGKLVEGAHTCRVSATNYYGHTSYIVLALNVGPKDVTAPTIDFGATDVYAPAGAFWCVNILGIDDYDSVVVEEKWSKTPTDIGGRLIKGEYTLALTVTDLTGNTATKTVYLHVTAEDTDVGRVVTSEQS